MQEQEGEEDMQKGKYPVEAWETAEKQAKPRIRSCATCEQTFITVPDAWDGYVHKNCCSRCTATGGWSHSKRCRNSTKEMWKNLEPYKNSWQGGAGSSQDGAGWWHQGLQHHSWTELDRTWTGQEVKENDGSLNEDKDYDEDGKLIKKEWW
eukprot:1959045-Heterocapsa_arctica.AAC.1